VTDKPKRLQPAPPRPERHQWGYASTTRERENAHRIATEYVTDPDRMGDFFRTLCKAIQLADVHNRSKLRQVYPDLVAYLRGELPI